MTNSDTQTLATSETTRIDLAKIVEHPDNVNRMPYALYAKLKRHLADTKRYPPLIVRPMGDDYEILDGHHRARALRELGHDAAVCVVWHVDDGQALTLLATLNRLSGQDDPRRRGALIQKLSKHTDISELAKRLPEDAKRLELFRQVAAALPKPTPPRPLEQVPVAVHFFLLPDQRATLEKTLKTIGGTREQALMDLASRA